MTDLRKAAEMAFDAFEDMKAYVTDNGAMPEHWDSYWHKQYDALEALRQALAQEQTKCPRCGEVNPAEIHTCSPQREQEPVAYLCENAVGYKYFRWKKPTSHYKPIALYTAPPSKQWVGLTDDERQDIKGQWVCGEFESFDDCLNVFETKLKEKNGAT